MGDGADTPIERSPEIDIHVEAEGNGVGEAKWNALKRLEPRFPGITAECVKFVVVSEGGDGPARVVGEVDEATWREVATTLPEEPAERLRALVIRVVQELGLRAEVDITETDEELRATVNGDDLGLLIGKHGATIDALQHLAMRIAFPHSERDKRVVIDAAGYRDRREEALHRQADRAIAEALEYDRPVELEPMRALERKVVHLYVRDRTDVETHSEGDEPDRRLVITPAAHRTP
ncbi:MAG TPA: RNA-binding cell elongation regulator Jag/EloR [Thermoleophilaceae bacterium]|nr:RNA-binding cell elongation regulator Jag/EloR [Thermoleophilaceae bacterium]